MKKLIEQKDFKVCYQPVCHSAPGLEELVRLLGAQLTKREESEFKKFKILSRGREDKNSSCKRGGRQGGAENTDMEEYRKSFSEFQLFQHHLEKLTQVHGLNLKIIEEAGLFSATAQTLNHILGRNDVVCDGIVIPYNDGFSRVRLDKPLILRNNKEAKYLSPTNSENRLYIPNSVRPILKDPSTTLFITEGKLKTLKLIQEGFPCIGIPGVWGFSRERKLLPGFDEINFKGRRVIIVLDPDAGRKAYGRK